MPRGKEIEQLPMSNIAPSIGGDAGKLDREALGTLVDGEQPKPSKTKKEGE